MLTHCAEGIMGFRLGTRSDLYAAVVVLYGVALIPVGMAILGDSLPNTTFKIDGQPISKGDPRYSAVVRNSRIMDGAIGIGLGVGGTLLLRYLLKTRTRIRK